MRCSSRSFVARIAVSWNPAASRILRAFDAQVGEVARVQPDAREPVAPCAQSLARRDRVAHAGQRVVRVHEEHDVVGQRVGVGRERRRLVLEGHDPTVRVGPAHRDAVAHPRQDVGRGPDPAHEGGPGRGQRPVGTLRAAQPELQHLVAVRRQTHARRLRGHEALEVEQVEQVRFQKLSLPERPAHAQDRLAGKDGRALRHGVHVAGERPRPAGQRADKPVVEEGLAVVAAQGAQVGQLLRGVAPARQQVHRLAQARRHREPAPEGRLPEKQVKRRLALRQTGPPVSASHRQLVEVRQQRRGRHARRDRGGKVGTHGPASKQTSAGMDNPSREKSCRGPGLHRAGSQVGTIAASLFVFGHSDAPCLFSPPLAHRFPPAGNGSTAGFRFRAHGRGRKDLP